MEHATSMRNFKCAEVKEQCVFFFISVTLQLINYHPWVRSTILYQIYLTPAVL